ncbi:hypothetical protein PHLGIDRAFT_21810 [Phlebiopsis gigantea 11061_1 CR5-6]|uniref:Peptidase M20 domain-containing protein 2 n=1 Tax=Phlebiopsis gigantea (strain 11061_1 CR5-6) TaxID=745531 RepID=A0A0C3SEY4_PHLG1|nr:hypothetical protein PHLGIDRAFT_21810 [Phlebiopsis gigantea 11061_1 CR5-6]
MKTIEEEIDRLSPQLREVSLKIHGNAELGFKEYFAHDVLTSFMEKEGFNVTRHYKANCPYPQSPEYMQTAWRAEFSHKPKSAPASGSARTLGVNSEMDALPVPVGKTSHACGHNLIAIAGVAVAVAVKKALEVHDVEGKVILLGTPAEEGGHGKVRLLEFGAYKEMDACLMCHPGGGPPHTAITSGSLAIQAIRVQFEGKPRCLSPWEGVNAQDAVMLSYNAIAMLRQQLRPDLRVHGVVNYGAKALAPNIIPATMAMTWNVRAPSKQDLDVLRERVIKCFEGGSFLMYPHRGAAIATGCSVKIESKLPALNLNQNSVLGDEFAHAATVRYGMTAAVVDASHGASTDFGNITYALPGLHPGYSIPTLPNGGNHTPEFAYAAGTSAAHDETLMVTKALSLVGFRVIDDDEFFLKVKQAFDATSS